MMQGPSAGFPPEHRSRSGAGRHTWQQHAYLDPKLKARLERQHWKQQSTAIPGVPDTYVSHNVLARLGCLLPVALPPWV